MLVQEERVNLIGKLRGKLNHERNSFFINFDEIDNGDDDQSGNFVKC